MKGNPNRQVAVADGAPPRLLRDPLLYGVGAFAVAVCGPISRYLGSLGDEGVVLHGAARLLRGEVIYRDFFEILAPGGFLVVAAWMKLIGADFGSVRVLAVAIIATIAALLYAAARLASGHRPLAAALALAWAIRAPFENNHHWFTAAASMTAAVSMFLALEGAPPRRGVAFTGGLFAGAAVVITQTRGVLLCVLMLAVLLTLPGACARLVSALAGMAVCPTAMIIYLAATGALAQAADDLLWFTTHRYAGVQAIPFGSFAIWADAVTVALFPVAFLLTGVALALKPHGAIWRDARGRTALALAVVGLLGAFPRPDIAHLNFTVPLACPLFALVATYLLGRLERPARVALSALLIGVCLMAIAYATMRRVDAITGPLEMVFTPRGLAVRRPSSWTTDLKLLMAQLDRVPAGDAVFFYPYLPMLPYLTGRHHPAAVDVILPGYTTPEQFSDTCVRVVRDVQWVVVDRSWSDERKFRALFPAMRDHIPPEKRALEATLAQAFDNVVHASTFFELRQRGAGAAHAPCQGTTAPGR